NGNLRNWGDGLVDPKFYNTDIYTNPRTTSDPSLIGSVDPDVPFRRVRKQVDPNTRTSSDPILGNKQYRSLADFERGFRDSTQNLLREMQEAAGNPTAIRAALDRHAATLDKMDAATDHINIVPVPNQQIPKSQAAQALHRDGDVTRNSMRLDFPGAPFREARRPGMVAIQRIAVQEAIIDARQLANELTGMAQAPNGRNTIEEFLYGVTSRLNQTTSVLGQFDSMIGRGWSQPSGTKLRKYPETYPTGHPQAGQPHPRAGQFETGQIVRRPGLRFGHELAEGSHAFTLGQRLGHTADDINIENKGGKDMQPLMQTLNDSSLPLEDRLATAGRTMVESIRNNQFQDLLYYLQKGAWNIELTGQGTQTNSFINPDQLFIHVREELERRGELGAYELGVLKRLEVEGRALSDNPEGQISIGERFFFRTDVDGNKTVNRSMRAKAAQDETLQDLMEGRFLANEDRYSDAGKEAVAERRNRFAQDLGGSYMFGLRDIDYAKLGETKAADRKGWRVPFSEEKGGWRGSTWRERFGTAGRIYGRWLTPVDGAVTLLKTSADNSRFLSTTAYGKFLRTPVATNTLRIAGHTAWLGGIYTTGGAILTSPFTPFGLVGVQGAGAIATATDMLFDHGWTWGYASSVRDYALGDGEPLVIEGVDEETTRAIEAKMAELEASRVVEAALAGEPFNVTDVETSYAFGLYRPQAALIDDVRLATATILLSETFPEYKASIDVLAALSDEEAAAQLASYSHYMAVAIQNDSTVNYPLDDPRVAPLLDFAIIDGRNPAAPGELAELVSISAEAQQRFESYNTEFVAALANLPTDQFDEDHGITEAAARETIDAVAREFANARRDRAFVTATVQQRSDQLIAMLAAQFDTDENGRITRAEVERVIEEQEQEEEARERRSLAGIFEDTDVEVPTWDEAKSSMWSAFNTLTDHDGDGVGVFVDTAVGRSISGTVSSVWNTVATGIGNMNQTRGGTQTVNGLMAFGGALFAPWLLSNIPGLGWINNRFFRPIAIFGAFFLGWKALNGGAMDLFTRSTSDDGETGDQGTEDGDAQGSGSYVTEEKLVNARIQNHEGGMPQTFEFDIDEDGEIDITLVDNDGDGMFVAQVADVNGEGTFVSTEMISASDFTGSSQFTPDGDGGFTMRNETSGREITIELINENGETATSVLRIGNQTFEMPVAAADLDTVTEEMELANQ
ncbi:MAG: hypothetical protein AB8B83_07045, partial [Bdellovibrionales bacterium]